MVWLKYPGSGANAVTMQPDGKILVAGYTYGATRAAVVRLLPNGSLDATFGAAGFVESYVGTSSTEFNAIALQADGKLVGVGSSRTTGLPLSVLLARHLTDGGLDPAFGDGGVVLTAFPGRAAYGESVVIQADGRILVGGYSEAGTTSTQDYILARFNADGSLDATFGTGGKVSIDLHGTADVPGLAALLPGGKVLLAGGTAQTTSVSAQFDVSATRVNADGTNDPTFADAGVLLLPGIGRPFNTPTHGVKLDGAGNVVLGGTFRAGGGDDFGVLRLTPAAVLDPTFGDAGVVITDFSARGDGANAVLVEPGGKIILVGDSSLGASTRNIAAARYLANGNLDTSFGTNGLLLTPPPANADLSGIGAALDNCGFVAVGVWGYDNNSLANTAMGVARYRR